ncbi:hypothetical protein HGRIS_004202 [Hohenbuehelia grisea]|uniref:Uncharacterized protein n=1 Tax=Hohenbuehelia grisea TaxID=104357 RepID=A0ABR3JI08_9AGAR
MFSSTSSPRSSMSTSSASSSHRSLSSVSHLLDRFGHKANLEQNSTRHLHKIHPGMWICLEDTHSASGQPLLDRSDKPVELMRTPAGDPFSHVLALSSRDAPAPSYNFDLHQVRTSLQLPEQNLMASWGIPDISAHLLFTARVFFGAAASELVPIKSMRRNAAGHRNAVNVLIVVSHDKIVEGVALAADALASHKFCSLDDAREELESSLAPQAEWWQGFFSREGVQYMESISDELGQDLAQYPSS